ncbi:hypothetical protein ROTAS13_04051 [Roseomonas sp. TAS13]|uniref:hypothetical protein n=1 Tax=Roseomonas TaxID=125216 RepID=UPI000965FCED|nr:MULTISPECIES: hypothetical protein [Roseomonas]MCG7351414.1 hypothetical protein [Roseomonas mucosa]MCG7358073.1 hypothetical protein [Roseomonas mucosa]GAV36364.1 hypothetical protein ROTAS13_04051 [Roseomonas sp. TAS13]
MRLLPLLLSAHPSAWTADAGQEVGQAGAHQGCCRFCGFDAAGRQEPFHRNGDHTDLSAANVVPACPLCHLCQHPDRPHIDAEATLIWLPEMSQAGLICLVRGIHLALRRHAEPVTARRPPRARAAELVPAYRTFRALLERAAPARDRLGSNSFAELGTALLALSPSSYANRAGLLAGLRLLPLGQLFRDGQDIYPDMLQGWLGASQPRI